MAKTTYNDIDKTVQSFPWVRVIFAVLVAMVLLVPSVGMLWAKSDETLENRELASWPVLFDEEAGLDIGFMAKAGDYFNDHFAYRASLIDAGAHLYASTFGVSTADTVVVGKDGWLYYAGTLSDYQDKSPLRQRQALNIAHNMALMQQECEAAGSNFVFTVAPDKNNLYGQSMPYYLPSVDSADRNLLKEALKAQGVNYVDAFELLGSQDERLYFLRDSHWTDKGALIVANALAQAGGFKTLGLLPEDLEAIDNYVGDLAKMLYPTSQCYETNWYAAGVNDGEGRTGAFWEFTDGESVDASVGATALTAQGDQALTKENGSLILYNDSFGHNLLPYLASEFETVSYGKKIPYNVLLVKEEQPSTVIVERAQRHVDYLAEEAPLMFSPLVDEQPVVSEPFEDFTGSIQTEVNGPLFGLSGFLDSEQNDLPVNAEIIVQLQDGDGNIQAFTPFYLSNDKDGNDFGFCVYGDADKWADNLRAVNVLVRDETGSVFSVYSQAMN